MPQDQSRGPSRRHDPYAALRNRNFALYTAGTMLSGVGFGAQSLAIGLEVYQRTSDPFLLGLTGLVTAIPMILLILPAGYIADAFDRRGVIMLSGAGLAVASLCLAYISYRRGSVGLMFLVMFVSATAATLGRPARTALLPLLVPRDIFENSVAWRMSLQQVSGVVGPALGGFLVAWHIPSAYVFCAVTTMCQVAILPLLRIEQKRERRQSEPLSTSVILAGLRFVWKTRLLFTTMALDLFAVLLGGAVYLLPVFALDILGVGEKGLGWLRAAPAAGALAMALIQAHLPPMKRAGRNMLLAVAGFGAATIVFGFSKSFWLSMAMLFLTGALDNISVVVRHTLMQLLTPDPMRGRVSAVSAIFIGSSNELGGFESGIVAKWTTPVVSVVSGSIGTLIVVAAAAWASPRLRRFGRLSDADPGSLEPTNTAEPATDGA